MYLLMRDLGWVNSYQALIIPGRSAPSACSSCASFPDDPLELEEAAKVDGASHFYIFTRIMVPMVRPR